MNEEISTPALTPYELKRDRLHKRIENIDADIAAVEARHAGSIEAANSKLRAAREISKRKQSQLAGVSKGIELLYIRISDMRAHIQQVEVEILREANDILKMEESRTAVLADIEAFEAASAKEVKECEKLLAEPTRHLAALQADKDRVQYRLTLHLARQPLTALFPGTKL